MYKNSNSFEELSEVLNYELVCRLYGQTLAFCTFQYFSRLRRLCKLQCMFFVKPFDQSSYEFSRRLYNHPLQACCNPLKRFRISISTINPMPFQSSSRWRFVHCSHYLLNDQATLVVMLAHKHCTWSRPQ